MRTENNYFGELVQNAEACGVSFEEPQFPCTENDEFLHQFVERLNEKQQAERAEKHKAGLCLPVSEFSRFADLADNLAGRIGLDFAADSQNGVGFLSLTGRGLELHSKEEPELIDSLTQIISHADKLCIETTQKYGQTLARIALYYDLDE